MGGDLLGEKPPQRIPEYPVFIRVFQNFHPISPSPRKISFQVYPVCMSRCCRSCFIKKRKSRQLKIIDCPWRKAIITYGTPPPAFGGIKNHGAWRKMPGDIRGEILTQFHSANTTFCNPSACRICASTPSSYIQLLVSRVVYGPESKPLPLSLSHNPRVVGQRQNRGINHLIDLLSEPRLSMM